MLGRYAELKAQLPEGTILFYQVGTFFETFEEDAKRISQALSIRLTSREAAVYAGDLTHPHAWDRDRGQRPRRRGVELPGSRIDARREGGHRRRRGFHRR